MYKIAKKLNGEKSDSAKTAKQTIECQRKRQKERKKVRIFRNWKEKIKIITKRQSRKKFEFLF